METQQTPKPSVGIIFTYQLSSIYSETYELRYNFDKKIYEYRLLDFQGRPWVDVRKPLQYISPVSRFKVLLRNKARQLGATDEWLDTAWWVGSEAPPPATRNITES